MFIFMKILATNWINVLGVFVAMLLYSVIFNQTNNHLNNTIFQSVVASLILICLYGLIFWGLFIAELAILDLLLILPNQKHIRQKLIIEWILVSTPYIYWLIRYKVWIFLVAIIAFAITQLLRKQLIVNILNA